jgi:hypothetical protein
MHIAAECSSRSMIPPTHASVRANADTGAARKIRTFQPVDDEPWSNQVMTSTPLVHVHSETPRLCVACHEHGTTLNRFLPVSWPLTNYRSSADPVVACRSAVSIAEPPRFVPRASGLQAETGRNVSTHAPPAVFTGTRASNGESARLTSSVVGHSARSR